MRSTLSFVLCAALIATTTFGQESFVIGTNFGTQVTDDGIVITLHANDEASPYFLVERSWVDESATSLPWSPTRLDGGRDAREHVLKAVHVSDLNELGLDPAKLRPLTWNELRNW